MAVLIKGMEMPTGCSDCWFTVETGLCVAAHYKAVNDCRWDEGCRPSWCPLVEVPEPNRVMSKEEMEAAGFET